MNSLDLSLRKPTHPVLASSIDYFLFIKNPGSPGSYKTFANTNTCLALYKQNNVSWDRITNNCYITPSQKTGVSKLFGFHNKPFRVNYKATLDQVCILFKLEGLSQFTPQPVNTIDLQDDPFTELFGEPNRGFIENLFEETEDNKRISLLEDFLLKRIIRPAANKQLAYAAALIAEKPEGDDHIVNSLSKKLSVDPSTLYRNFQATFGQSPIHLHKTTRFRRTLKDLISRKENFTRAAYSNEFYDQSHLVKDIKQFTGETPGRLVQKIKEVGNSMLMIQDQA
jgi:AraC-like DNA-binding protein